MKLERPRYSHNTIPTLRDSLPTCASSLLLPQTLKQSWKEECHTQPSAQQQEAKADVGVHDS